MTQTLEASQVAESAFDVAMAKALSDKMQAVRFAIGQKLRQARIDRNKTQRQVGIALGYANGCIVSMYETGQAKTTDICMLAQMAAVVGCPLDELLEPWQSAMRPTEQAAA